jgi:hypothetical protein
MTSMISPPVALRGVQAPRISSVPAFSESSGHDAVRLAAKAGLALDPWQQAVLVGSLGERPDGKWSAFEVGLVVPRQNGKGSILEARELAGLFLFEEERLIIHSAHEQATSSEHFLRLLNLIEGVPELKARVLKAPQGKGAEGIWLKDGSRILFKTRTGGGGRGLTGDLVVLDEAMILPEAVTSALVPVMAARSMEGNPQLWYTGSAVDQAKNDNGVVLARVRERGINGSADLAYFEWSASGEDPSNVPDAVRSDPAVWAVANPGMGIRISAEHIAKEAGGALGPRGFAVERLGIGDWPDTDDLDGRVFQPGVWLALTDVASHAPDPVCFAVDVTPDRSSAAIGVAGRRGDGRWHAEIIDHRRGTEWVVDRLAGLVERHKAVAVADGVGPAASLVPELTERGVTVHLTKTQEHVQACGQFYDAVKNGTLRHLGTEELTDAVDGAARRPVGDAWAWSRKDSGADISPLVAVTLARWGAETLAPPTDAAQNIW